MILSGTTKRQIVAETFENTNNKGIIEYLDSCGYYDAPASKNHHGNWRGALFEHSFQVAYELQRMTNLLDLKWQREESPMIVGLLHDLCKVDQYNLIEDTFRGVPIETVEYNKNQLITGHGDKSCILALQHIDLTNEEIMCIRYHMGPFIPEDKDNYTKAVIAYPNVLYTHTADMIAAQVKGI